MPVDLPPPPPAYVHAHRGGPTLAGVHTFGEETMSAFRHAHQRLGAVLEVDAKLTADGVPVVIHDATLDRTTPCTGRVDARTAGELAGCPVDVLGSPGGSLGGIPTTRTEPIASLLGVLEYARESGATVNLEIKNIPTEADFDPTTAFADTVLDVVEAARFPPQRLIIQSFWPPNLEVAKRRIPGAQTALLTLAAMNDGAVAFATARDYEWVSPEWPVDAMFVEQAHTAGRKVVPYTLNTTAEVKAAREVGVDAVITDDPLMARRALGIADPAAGDSAPPVVRLRLATVASSSFRSETIRLRWRGEDDSGIAGYRAEVRRIGSDVWRTVSLGRRISVRFKATPGAAYVLRVRAQDNAGNLGEYARGSFVVPLDQTDRRVRFSPGWRTVSRAGAWRRSVAITYLAGQTAKFTFTGRRLRVIGARVPNGGRLRITVDGRSRTVSTRGATADRRVLFDSRALRRGRHTVRLQALGGGPVLLDALAPS